MKKFKPTFIFYFISIFTGLVLLFSGCSQQTELSSPDGSILVTCRVNEEQEAFYAITKDNQVIILPSKLGVIMEDNDFSQNLKLLSTSKIKAVTDTYEMTQGKKEFENIMVTCKHLHLRTLTGPQWKLFLKFQTME